jgi:hypothetical protein
MKFTKQSIADLALPGGKSDAIWFDDTLPGFGVRLRAGGKAVWIVQYRVGQRQRRETLGDVRKVDLETARTAAKKRFAQVLLGADPQAEKAEAPARQAHSRHGYGALPAVQAAEAAGELLQRR